MELNADFLKLYEQAFYGRDILAIRAEELAQELRALVDAAGFQTKLPGFEDSPDRFAAALVDTAWVGRAQR
ncbi:hypothetical protein [Paralcaligenes ureilyticus]|uniref:hypothetical protein n=1 Tax=Paralcaligenes ureilyticus TaxID=627131 RepID=UPI00104A80DF|nr:hypothetical protein [Paralcaligenes ureilyticus]